MTPIITFYKKTLKYNIVNKFLYHKITKLPKSEQIYLHFKIWEEKQRKVFCCLLALELLINQKHKILGTNFCTKISSEKNFVICRSILKTKLKFSFLQKIIFKFLPKINSDFKVKDTFKQKLWTKLYLIFNLFQLSQFTEHYFFFSNLPHLKIEFVINTHFKEEACFFFKQLRFPIK